MTTTTERQIDFDETLDAIDGMTYTHEGVHGTIDVCREFGRLEICHKASARGKLTDKYRETRARLGDDYVTSWEGECPEEFWAEVERRGLIQYK